ncbi:MAG TPA: histidine kinase, partial [Actinomycetota bacterium]|nr:histidine kinase [Actinomycetota bacterium]
MPAEPRPIPRGVAWLAWTLAATCLLLLGALTWLSRSNHEPWASFLDKQSFTLVFGLVFPLAGAVIASRHPRNVVPWLMIGAPFFAILQSAANAYARHALIVAPGSIPAGDFVSWVDAWAWVPLAQSGPLLFLFLPDGRLLSRRWRWVLYAALAELVITLTGFMATWPVRGAALLEGADKLPSIPLLTKVAEVTFPLFFLVFLASIVSVIARFVRSRGEERQQLKWITFGVVLMFVEFIATTIHQLPPIVDALTIVPLGVALGIAILKYRLYEIDLVINKTLVYGSMAAFITAVYVAVVVGIGHAVGSQRNLGLSILATALVAVGFQPVRERIRRLANRLVYGNRASPYDVLAEFSGGMSHSVATDELLPRMARMVADGTGAAEVNVWLHVGSELVPEASWPRLNGAVPEMRAVVREGVVTVEGSTAAVPVRHQGELLGAIAVKKAPGDALKPAESKVLDDLASQAGLVLRNVRLIEELRTSRQRLVTAQDEERRRLERDLHDGAQQRIVSIALAIRLARGLVSPEKPEVGSRLDQASEQIQLAL